MNMKILPQVRFRLAAYLAYIFIPLAYCFLKFLPIRTALKRHAPLPKGVVLITKYCPPFPVIPIIVKTLLIAKPPFAPLLPFIKPDRFATKVARRRRKGCIPSRSKFSHPFLALPSIVANGTAELSLKQSVANQLNFNRFTATCALCFHIMKIQVALPRAKGFILSICLEFCVAILTIKSHIIIIPQRGIYNNGCI